MAYKIDVYKRTDKKYAWRLLADNGEIVAVDGGQGYENKQDCIEIAEKISTATWEMAEQE